MLLYSLKDYLSRLTMKCKETGTAGIVQDLVFLSEAMAFISVKITSELQLLLGS